MTSQGILHYSSCTHTQVAECENHHLIEFAHTLLLHTHIPLCFWGDAILTACYLINYMPSSVLYNQIPHSLLFLNQCLFILFSFIFLVAHVLFIISSLDRINILQKLLNAYFWATLDFKKDIGVIPHTPTAISPQQMSIFLRNLLSRLLMLSALSYLRFFRSLTLDPF